MICRTPDCLREASVFLQHGTRSGIVVLPFCFTCFLIRHITLYGPQHLFQISRLARKPIKQTKEAMKLLVKNGVIREHGKHQYDVMQ